MNEPLFADKSQVSADSLVGKHVNPTMSFFLAKALADVKKRNEAIERDAVARKEWVEAV